MNKVLALCALMCATVTTGIAQCDDGEMQIEIIINPDQYDWEISWDLVGVSTTYASGLAEGATVCVTEGDCISFLLHDSYGDGIFNADAYTINIDGELFETGTFDGYEHQVIIDCWEGGVCDTASAVEPGDWMASNGNAWYTFTPEVNGMYLVTTCAEANTCDTRLWIYDYCNMSNFDNSNEGSIYFDDNEGGCGEQAQFNALLEGGVTYWIRIGSTAGDCGDTDVFWSLSYNGLPEGCTDPEACNYSPIADLDDGTCVYEGDPLCAAPDLIIVEEAIANSIYAEVMFVDESDCYIEEGCLNGYGERELIRFTTHIKNIGDVDYYIGPTGDPDSPEQFEWGDCHNHWHYEGYAAYMLTDAEDNLLPIGQKNGFCVMDLECSDGGTFQYGCSVMGISAHCGDIYSSGLSCQWIDVTGIADGIYKLGVIVNWDHTPDALGREEASYDNNWGQVCLELDRTSGELEVVVIEESCEPYVDCNGNVWGNATVDCNGECGGSALAGDLDANGEQELIDAEMYVDHILGDDIESTLCNDLNASGNITVADAALLSLCNVYNLAHEHPDSSGVHNKCNLPTDNIVNVFDTTTFSIGNVNFNENYLDVHVKNPYNRIVGYQFLLTGLEITSVVSIADPIGYPITPSFLLGGQEVIGLSYQDSSLAKSPEFQALCRVYFINPEDEICIDPVVDVVNEDYHTTLHNVVDGCVISSSVDEVALQREVMFSPNPMTQEATLSFYNPTREQFTLVITDLAGREVMRQTGITGTSVRIDRDDLAVGTYQYVLQGRIRYTGKFGVR